MRSLKKFLALVLSLVMAAGTVSTFASAARFTDVPASDEALTKAVDLLSSVGITTGTTDTTYGTSEGVTRQQMATFIYRLMKAGKTVEGKEGDNSTSFTDLDDPFYYFMISWANDMGIIKGRNSTTFDPKGGIILQDAYVMLTRALGYEKEEALAYPFDYIKIAEKIGLDDNLPANVGYETALTRGNVAILLSNAFYADMATGETGYRYEYEEKLIPTTGTYKLVQTDRVPYTIHDTVAEKVFGVKKTVQRIVATPNYSLDRVPKTADSSDGDTEIITVACFDEDYAATDDGLFGDIDFTSLKLSGKADDYFLMDLAIYYKQEAAYKEPEIVAASSLGTYKKGLPAGKVKFESTSKYAYQADGGYSAATGKVTIDGQVSYLFDAPWSYSKPSEMEDKDKDCITLLWLAPSTRDPEDEDYVIDFNFESHKDVLGRGSESYTGAGTLYKKNGEKWERVNTAMTDADLRGHGLYSMAAMVSLMQVNPYSGAFEADAWDSNSDGKYDYLWLKPYTIGQAKSHEDEPTKVMHGAGFDAITAVYGTKEVPTIYTYGAVTEGVNFKDGQLITGYINGAANYIKVATAQDLKYTPDQTYNVGGGGDPGRNFGFNNEGRKERIQDLVRRYVGVPDQNGAKFGAVGGGSMLPWGAPNYNNITWGSTYDIAFVGNAMFHVKGSNSKFSATNEYAIIIPNKGNAITTSVGIVTDGVLEKSGDMLTLLVDGQIENVLVKPQTSSITASNNLSSDKAYSLMPVTPYDKNGGVYDFEAYIGKLLTYTVNDEEEYTLRIAPMETYTDKSVLLTDNDDIFYAYQKAESDPFTKASLVKSSGSLYQIVTVGANTPHAELSPAKYLNFGEDTIVVIKTVDKEDTPVYTVYDSENKPNFSNKDALINIKYIVKNNPKSTTMEELVYFYAEAADGSTGVKAKSTLDFRFIKAFKTVGSSDGTKVVYYDVFNPFNGSIDKEFEAVDDSTTCAIDGIYAVSNGYLNNEDGVLGYINKYGNAANEGVKTGLGLVEIADYDEDSGLLSTSDGQLYLVDDKTAISFLDYDKGEITTKTADILNTTAKTYKCNDNSDMPLLAFIASSEVKNEDAYEYAGVICIVRCNALDVTTP